MADKEELSTGNTSQTTSSSLTDSWSMVNQHGDILVVQFTLNSLPHNKILDSL